MIETHADFWQFFFHWKKGQMHRCGVHFRALPTLLDVLTNCLMKWEHSVALSEKVAVHVMWLLNLWHLISFPLVAETRYRNSRWLQTRIWSCPTSPLAAACWSPLVQKVLGALQSAYCFESENLATAMTCLLLHCICFFFFAFFSPFGKNYFTKHTDNTSQHSLPESGVRCGWGAAILLSCHHIQAARTILLFHGCHQVEAAWW